MFCEGRGQPENTAARILSDAVNPAPFRTANTWNAVMFCQRLVQERVVGIENIQDRSVALKQIRKEANRFLVDCAAQARECREVAFALFIESVEVVDVQPLAGELGSQPPHARVVQHTASLCDQGLRFAQFASFRGSGQLGIGYR